MTSVVNRSGPELFRPCYRLAAWLLAGFVLLLAACSGPQQQILSHSGMTMGTSFTVKWVARPNTDPQQLAQLLDQTLINVNQSMSTYIEDSELSRLNLLPPDSEQSLSGPLAEVLQLALQIGEQSQGAFDVTVGPLVNLWGFGPDGRVVHAPSQAQIDQVAVRVGQEKLQFDPVKRSLKKNVQSYIDLSAIAKGYGVDQLARLLEQQGIEHYLVEIGGELRARGQKPNGQHWRIAIESPQPGLERSVQRVIEVRDVGIATSGDYRNYFEEKGVRFSHTINPATAAPINHRLASVTVLMPTCAEADALATAIMVMGPDKGMDFAVKHHIKVFMLVKTESGFEEQMSPGFEQFLVQ